jgi:hypothetical protein
MKEDIYKKMNEFKENAKGWLKLGKLQDMKEEFKKDTEILKNSDWNSGNKKLNESN